MAGKIGVWGSAPTLLLESTSHQSGKSSVSANGVPGACRMRFQSGSVR